MSQQKVKALIQLLDDPDREIHKQVTNELLSLGQEVIPSLESAWENCLDPTLQRRIEEVVHKIQYENTADALARWAKENDPDLLEGMILVSRYQYPHLQRPKIEDQIADIERDIWIELNQNLTAFEKVNVFNHVFYELYGFQGNTSNFLDPQNCYINRILETHKGTPVSLGLLYLILAQRLNLPIKGVNLPQHFVLAYENQATLLSSALFPEKEDDKVLFYINPFNKGAVFTQKEIFTYLKKLNINPKKPNGNLRDDYFYPCSKKTTIKQLLIQLKNAYEKLSYHNKVEELRHLISILAE